MIISADNITAVVIAGGKGSRLGGQDKGLVHYDGKPLVEHILKKIKPQVSAILINANRNLDIYKTYGYPVFSDNLSDFQGPLAGFSSAMALAKTSHILTLPCDGPFIASDLVARMLKETENDPNAIVVAHDGKRLQSLYALIPVTLHYSLHDFLASGERKVGAWYEQHVTKYADFSDKPEAFTNMNTEKDFSKQT